jgi:endonuclease/exonuclease/phosphatase family metal-dependent hydrolase
MFRVGTFNLENFDSGPGVEPPLAERIAVLRPQLLRMDADILCLQEVNAQKPDRQGPRVLAALDELLADTPYADHHRASTGKADESGYIDKHNLVTLSRFPIEHHSQHRHDLVSPPRYRPATAEPAAAEAQAVEWDRSVLQSVHRLDDGRRLHVFNLHLRAPLAAAVEGQKESAFVWRSVAGWAEGYYLAAMKRAGQALETRLLIERIFDRERDALIVVCGDFNADDHEVPSRLLRAADEDTGNAALAERSLIPVERTLAQDRRFTVIHRGRPQTLDHLLVSRALLARYRGVEIHNEELGDEYEDYVARRTVALSHHAPVIATFAGDGDC